MLRSTTGAHIATHTETDSFVDALRQAMMKGENIERLFAVWEQNVSMVRTLSSSRKAESRQEPHLAFEGLRDRLCTA
jgi:hypothetical protein